MFSEFFAAIRVARVMSLIAARHIQTEIPSTQPYHHPLEQTLFEALNGASSGVFVHWGVYESGKSTAVRQMAWRLQEEAGRQVIVLQGYDFSWYRPVSTWLRRSIGIPEGTDEPLSQLLAKTATTLIIDHFDMRDKDNHGAERLELVRALIQESAQTQRFNVLLVMNSWERARELVDAGCGLVPSDAPARWTRDQLEALYATFPDSVKGKVGANKDELLRLATLSGTPEFLTCEARGYDISANHAVIRDREWRMGAKALYDDESAVSAASHDTMVGRFPDKNGRYHHEDLALVGPLAIC
jgi:hypothetical protein